MDYTESAKYKLSNSETFYSYDPLEFMKSYKEAFKTIFDKSLNIPFISFIEDWKPKIIIFEEFKVFIKASFFVSFPVFYRV